MSKAIRLVLASACVISSASSHAKILGTDDFHTFPFLPNGENDTAPMLDPKHDPKPGALPTNHRSETRIEPSDGGYLHHFGSQIAVDEVHLYIAAVGDLYFGGGKVYVEDFVATTTLPNPPPNPPPKPDTNSEPSPHPFPGPSDGPTDLPFWAERSVIATSQMTESAATSICASDGHLFVAAVHDTSEGFDAGAVFVIENPTGVTAESNGPGHKGGGDGAGAGASAETIAAATIRLVASDGSPHAKFGSSVSASGALLAVGAAWDVRTAEGAGAGAGAGRMNVGSVYLFDRSDSGWSEKMKIEAFQGGPTAQFGSAVSLTNETLAVAAVGDSTATPFGGAVFVFNLSSLSSATTSLVTATSTSISTSFSVVVLAPTELDAHASFGSTIHFTDSRGLVTALDTASGRFCVHVFERVPANDAWVHVGKLFSPSGKAGDFFGASLAFYKDEVAVVGAPGDDEFGTMSGAAYLFAKAKRPTPSVRAIGSIEGPSVRAIGSIEGEGSADAASDLDLPDHETAPDNAFPENGIEDEVEDEIEGGDEEEAEGERDGGDGDGDTSPEVLGRASSVDGNNASFNQSIKSSSSNGSSSGRDVSISRSTQQDGGNDISWRLVYKLTNVDKAAMARYGQAVAVWENSLIVGADIASGRGEHTGVVYVEKGVFVSDADDWVWIDEGDDAVLGVDHGDVRPLDAVGAYVAAAITMIVILPTILFAGVILVHRSVTSAASIGDPSFSSTIGNNNNSNDDDSNSDHMTRIDVEKGKTRGINRGDHGDGDDGDGDEDEDGDQVDLQSEFGPRPGFMSPARKSPPKGLSLSVDTSGAPGASDSDPSESYSGFSAMLFDQATAMAPGCPSLTADNTSCPTFVVDFSFCDPFAKRESSLDPCAPEVSGRDAASVPTEGSEGISREALSLEVPRQGLKAKRAAQYETVVVGDLEAGPACDEKGERGVAASDASEPTHWSWYSRPLKPHAQAQTQSEAQGRARARAWACADLSELGKAGRDRAGTNSANTCDSPRSAERGEEVGEGAARAGGETSAIGARRTHVKSKSLSAAPLTYAAWLQQSFHFISGVGGPASVHNAAYAQVGGDICTPSSPGTDVHHHHRSRSSTVNNSSAPIELRGYAIHSAQQRPMKTSPGSGVPATSTAPARARSNSSGRDRDGDEARRPLMVHGGALDSLFGRASHGAGPGGDDEEAKL